MHRFCRITQVNNPYCTAQPSAMSKLQGIPALILDLSLLAFSLWSFCVV